MRHPHGVLLSIKKCPDCKESFAEAALKPEDGRVDAHCPNSSCSYRLPLFWLGETRASMN